MSYIYQRKSEKISNETFDFEVTDKKGRAIGYRVAIYSATFSEEAGNFGWEKENHHNFFAVTSALRDGIFFGAITAEIHGQTLEGVQQAAQGRLNKYKAKVSK